MKFRRRFEIKHGIDLTPMIDIVFNLLIFFMVGTTIIDTPQIRISLPKSSSASGTEENENIIITISQNGEKFVNGEKVENIDLYLKDMAKAEGAIEKTVQIRADENVITQTLIDVIDSVKNAGFSKLSIATDKNTAS